MRLPRSLRAFAFASLCGACSPVVTADAGPVDTGSRPVDAQGALSCGSLTCGSGEVCVLECSGIDAAGVDLHRCVPIPPACANDVSCGCLSLCGGGSGGVSCDPTSDRSFRCSRCA